MPMWCPTCFQNYPPTLDYWLLHSKRRRDSHGMPVYDAAGIVIEDWFVYCRICQAGKAPNVRRCMVCKEVKPRNVDYFRKRGVGFMAWCRPCQDTYMKHYQRLRKKSA